MKNVLITGASRGIGRAIALKMAEGECRLFLNSLTGGEKLAAVRDEIIRYRNEHGVPGEVYPVPCDVGDPDAVRGMFGTIGELIAREKLCEKGTRKAGEEDISGYSAESEGIDILINNAGISFIGLTQDTDDETWNRILAVNLSSVHYCCREAIPHMLAAGEGRILNISSVWGNTGASCEVAYSASKGGVNAFTKALAKELAPSHIAVNAIACGCIDTDMNRHFDEAERAGLCEEIPAGRFASPDEVAELAAAICGQSTYLTGQIITFDGGWT